MVDIHIKFPVNSLQLKSSIIFALYLSVLHRTARQVEEVFLPVAGELFAEVQLDLIVCSYLSHISL